jgi:hypothetical protein
VVYTEEQRKAISEECKGKIVKSLEWSPSDKNDIGYWVMTFTDGSEVCFRLMAELVNPR